MSLRDDLGASANEVRETHISWVFLHDDVVYKVKKPVDFGFLCFTTLEEREHAVRAEVELNRRLSPEVYLGAVPVTRGEDGIHRVGGDGRVVDWAVHMRRLADEDRVDQRLARDDISDDDLLAIARKLAEFHGSARVDEETSRFGTPEAIAVNVRENFEQTRDSVEAHLSPEEAAEIEGFQMGFLEARKDLFQSRIDAERVRDGHGDLRTEQMYVVDGQVKILDCIEFNERFRFGDVAADVAFLSMDLGYRARVDLADRFLALYAREAQDFDLYSLVDFYESYRAYVRGKVASMLAADPDAPAEVRERAAEEARRYYLLSLAAPREPALAPQVVAVGGVIATGKSTVSDRLSMLIGAPVVESDRTRKHMVGARPTEKLYEGSWAGAYDPEFTEKVYGEVYRRAGVVLESGRPVILDASFRSKAMRARAKQLADDNGVPFRFVECVAPPDVCRARLKVRELGESVSDGRLEIFDDFLTKWEAVTREELPDEEHVVLDTSGEVGDAVTTLRARLDTWDGLSS